MFEYLVENDPILIIFDAQNPEKIMHIRCPNFPPQLKSATTLFFNIRNVYVVQTLNKQKPAICSESCLRFTR